MFVFGRWCSSDLLYKPVKEYFSLMLSFQQVGFAHPGVAASVMVYLASDGSWSGEQCRRTATILLSDTAGKNHTLGAWFVIFTAKLQSNRQQGKKLRFVSVEIFKTFPSLQAHTTSHAIETHWWWTLLMTSLSLSSSRPLWSSSSPPLLWQWVGWLWGPPATSAPSPWPGAHQRVGSPTTTYLTHTHILNTHTHIHTRLHVYKVFHIHGIWGGITTLFYNCTYRMYTSHTAILNGNIYGFMWELKNKHIMSIWDDWLH